MNSLFIHVQNKEFESRWKGTGVKSENALLQIL